MQLRSAFSGTPLIHYHKATHNVGKGFFKLFKTMLGNYTFLSFREINSRIKDFVASHNSLHRNAEGKKELKYQIRNARLSAMKNVINAYSKYVSSYRKNPKWETAQTIPSMPINRPTIAKMVGCCEKSAYNHIDFLINAGVLLKRFHGRQNDFSVVINPYFWLEEFANQKKIVDLKFLNQTATPPPVFSQNLPPISSYDSQEIDNQYKKDVETVEKPLFHQSNTTPPQFQQTHSSDIFSRKGSEQTRNEVSGGGSVELSTMFSTQVAITLKNVKDKGNGTDKTVGGATKDLINLERSPKILENEAEAWKLVANFTRIAFEKLYSNTFYTEKTIAEVKNLIMRDVFNNFKGSTNDILSIRNRYIDAKAALDNAIEYAQKHHWTSFLPPKCYFSRDFFKQGKRGTFFEALEWRMNQKQELERAKCMQIIENCKRLVVLEKSPRGRRDLTTKLQISQYCSNYIAKKCGAFYVSIWNQWLANPSNHL